MESAGFTPPEPNSNKMPTDGNPNDTAGEEEEGEDQEDLEEEFEEEIEEIIEEFDEEEEFDDDAVQDFEDSSRPLNNAIPNKEMERQASRGGPQAPQVRASVQFAGVGPIEEEDDQDQTPVGVH